MENSPTFCELDYKITSSEIMKAISKLKSGKAVGLDSLPNELFLLFKIELNNFLIHELIAMPL
jgi:chromosome condensin MukBEF MukE localization factor